MVILSWNFKGNEPTAKSSDIASDIVTIMAEARIGQRWMYHVFLERSYIQRKRVITSKFQTVFVLFCFHAVD